MLLPFDVSEPSLNLLPKLQGRGFSPDGRTPNNKQVPVAQRLNEAGTHYYTKVRPDNTACRIVSLMQAHLTRVFPLM